MHLQYRSLQLRIKLESLGYLYSRHVLHPFRHLDKNERTYSMRKRENPIGVFSSNSSFQSNFSLIFIPICLLYPSRIINNNCMKYYIVAIMLMNVSLIFCIFGTFVGNPNKLTRWNTNVIGLVSTFHKVIVRYFSEHLILSDK